MIPTEEFLRLILPSEGFYCAVVFPAKSHHWFTDLGEMAAFLLAEGCGGPYSLSRLRFLSDADAAQAGERASD